jgi:hypothetical protein
MDRRVDTRAAMWVCVAATVMLCAPTSSPRSDPLPIVPPGQRGSVGAERAGMHDAGNIRTLFWNFGQIGDFPEDPLNVDLGAFHSVEAPIGSGMNNSQGITPFVLARVTTVGGGTAYIMETGYRERQEVSPVTGRIMRFEPRPGYFQADPSINPGRSPAMSDDPATWPPYWPDKLGDPGDPGWAGQWNGFFGKGATAIQESFTVMDDQAYDAWDYHPDARDATRRGLGLKLEVRALQSSDPVARDVIFWHYDVVNEGTTAYDDNIILGLYAHSSVGGLTLSCDGIFESDDDHACSGLSEGRGLAYAWDGYGHGVDLSGSCASTGYLGYALLQTPGNPFDAIDNDQDGIVDERQDGGTGTLLAGQSVIRAYFTAHYDTTKFKAYHGRLEDRPAFLAGKWWTGDEDLDWDPLTGDLGADGISGTHDIGETDGQPTMGEPDFERRDPGESDQIGLTGFKTSRIRAGWGNPDPTTDNVVFYTDAQNWPQRLWDHFTAPDPAARFDPCLIPNYNLAFLLASGPFKLDVGETQRFSVAVAYAPTFNGLLQTVEAADLLNRGDYAPLLVGVPGSSVPVPGVAVLLGNRPNPFQRSTTIGFALPAANAVRLEVFDLQGRVVATRELGTLAAGRQQVRFDATGMGPGLYLYRLRMGESPGRLDGTSPSGKMLLMW